MQVTILNKIETNNIEMKFYVFCNDTHDGGRLEEFKTLEKAKEYTKKDSNAEQIILGIDVTNVQP